VSDFTHNSQTVLHDYAEAQRLARDPDEEMKKFWEFFVANLVTKQFDLTDEEIGAGITGAGGDGGIDFIYVLIDGQILDEDTLLEDMKRAPEFVLIIGQAKTSKTFKEDTINRLIAVTRDLLTLSVLKSEFADVYNEDVRSAFALFRSAYRTLLPKLPKLKISYFYGANRPPNEISAGLENRRNALLTTAKEKFPDAAVTVDLLGATDMWTIASARPKDVSSLKVQRVSAGRRGYICLVTLDALDEFLRPDGAQLNQTLFDSNVRHYLKSTPVNTSIAKSLAEPDDIDFWWLNNGVTILGSSINLNDDTLTIRDPQVVNGLQTSIQVARHFTTGGAKPDTRAILVKAITVEADDVRDQIIRATNNQNPVSTAMLRATDEFQRTIESYFSSKSLFYDRRKGYWASQGKPISQIISLTFLAQTVMSILLFRPDDARARPSNPIGNDEDYVKIFSDTIPLAVYLHCALLGRKSEHYLRRVQRLPKGEVNNLRFYLTVYASWILLGTSSPNAEVVAAIQPEALTDELFSSAFGKVKETYDLLGASDDVTKSSRLKQELKKTF
jgi:hypothetical protein